MLIFCDCLNQGKAIWPIWLIILFENKLNKHSLTVKGLADSLSSLPATTFPFCLVSLSFSMEGGFTNTMKGLNSAVRRCFIIWEGERERAREKGGVKNIQESYKEAYKVACASCSPFNKTFTTALEKQILTEKLLLTNRHAT